MGAMLDFGMGKSGEDNLQPFRSKFADIDSTFRDSIGLAVCGLAKSLLEFTKVQSEAWKCNG